MDAVTLKNCSKFSIFHDCEPLTLINYVLKPLIPANDFFLYYQVNPEYCKGNLEANPLHVNYCDAKNKYKSWPKL